MSLADRFASIRNRIVASPRFQSFASAFPLTRWIANRRAEELFGLCSGFVHSQILFACVDLDIFQMLRAGPLSVADVAARTGLPEEAAERLLKAATALKLLARRGDGRYGLAERGAALLGNPSVFAMVRHHQALYADLADPVGLLRNRRTDTALARFWGYADAEGRTAVAAGQAGAYSELMAATQAFIAEDVLAIAPLAGRRTLMDLGGGEGAFLAAAARRHPNLQLILCDLPAVAERARARFAREGLESRASAVGLDLFTETPPPGADAISLVRVLHDHEDDGAMRFLRAARAALAPGGVLIVAEPLAETPGCEAMGDAYFGFYLWAMGSGRPRSAASLTDMLRAAGFSRVRACGARRPLLTSVLVAGS
ncbi:MAG: methyltransferase [Pseudomonadota bacterium]